jgi:hypothetical protein
MIGVAMKEIHIRNKANSARLKNVCFQKYNSLTSCAQSGELESSDSGESGTLAVLAFPLAAGTAAGTAAGALEALPFEFTKSSTSSATVESAAESLIFVIFLLIFVMVNWVYDGCLRMKGRALTAMLSMATMKCNQRLEMNRLKTPKPDAMEADRIAQNRFRFSLYLQMYCASIHMLIINKRIYISFG